MKLIARFFYALFTLFITPALFAQTSGNSLADNHSLLWKITGNKLSAPSYLFGTMHLICEEDFIWTKVMRESLDKCEKVCFEMDMDNPGLMTEVAAGMIDNSGKKLEEYFKPDDYLFLKQYLHDSLNLDIAMFAHMNPMALESIISTREVSCPNSISYEDTIMKLAQNKKKEVLGLEEAKEQLDVMNSISPDTLVLELMEELRNGGKNDEEYRKMVVAYKEQDIAALHSMITASAGMGPDMTLFLDERNVKWIPRMADKMKKSSVFFAVGAGHLWGENGVINMLRKNGFTVQPCH